MSSSSSPAVAVAVDADLASRILRQVEYYFGDSNYPRDAFLLKTASEPVNEGVWIPLATLLTFNRLKTLTTDPAVIVAALRTKYPKGTDDHNDAPLLVLSEDETKIKRGRPLPAATTDEQLAARTIMVKGFALDSDLDLVAQAFEGFKTASVRLRRFNGAFKGAAFVEFESEEEANRYLAEQREYKGAKLEAMTKKDFEAQGKDAKEKDDDEKKAGGKGDKKDAKKDKKDAKDPKKNKDGEAEAEGDEQGDEQDEKEIPKDCLVYFENAGDDATREELKATFGEYGHVSFVDFNKGQPGGYIRFNDEGGAAKAVQGLTEKGTEIGGKKPSLRVLEGDEEKEYWAKLRSGEHKRNARGRGGHTRGRGGRGGRRGNFGKRNRDGGNESSSKRQKAE